jgi:hypothetical protein
MNKEVTVEEDGISKAGYCTHYFFLPRFDFAIYSVEPLGDGFIVRGNVSKYKSFHHSKDEAENVAENIITTARQLFALARDSEPFNSDGYTRESFLADVKWIMQAVDRLEARRNSDCPADGR